MKVKITKLAVSKLTKNGRGFAISVLRKNLRMPTSVSMSMTLK
jgi:hypothetical protein